MSTLTIEGPICLRGCDHPQPVKTRRGLVCMDCWVHRRIISILRETNEGEEDDCKSEQRDTLSS